MKNPEITDITQIAILIPQRGPDMSAIEGMIRIGTPIATMRPCFHVSVRANWPAPDWASAVSDIVSPQFDAMPRELLPDVSRVLLSQRSFCC